MESRVAVEEKLVVRKKFRDRFRVALVYPNVYRVAMSNLGYRILYHMLNNDDRIYCERFTYDSSRSLETGSDLRDFDLIMFSYQYELDLVKIAEIIVRNGLFNKPKIVGGPCTYNPFLLKPFVEYVYIGEAESKLQAFIEAIMENREDEEIAKIEGIYVSSISSNVTKTYPHILDTFLPSLQVSSNYTIFGDALMVDVSRGCKWGCLFCLGRSIYSPYRERSIDQLIQTIGEGMVKGGYSSLVMIASDLNNYSNLDELLEYVEKLMNYRKFKVIAPSLRADIINEKLLEVLVKSGEKTVTLAPESSEEVRFRIGKKIRDEVLIEACKIFKKTGIKKVKLYFMFGIPGETIEDLKTIVKIIEEISKLGLKVKVSANPFIPKPHTPLQDAEFEDPRELREKLKFLKKKLGKVLTTDGVKQAYIQAIISRGDEEIGKLILEVLGKYGVFSLKLLRREMEKIGLDINEYARWGSPEKPWKKIKL
ncbi:MAG: radical SAM protein [Nitrososphaerota archaeon]